MLKWLRRDSRQPRPRRIAVIDAAPVDGRRRVVLVRRDNVEHLLIIGGPTDVVIESKVMRTPVAREPAGPPAHGWQDPPHLAAPRRAPAVEPSPQTIQNLSELTRRLEAALGRAPAPRHRPPVNDSRTVLPPSASIVPARLVTPSDEPILEFELPRMPTSDAKPETKKDAESKVQPKLEQLLEPRLKAELAEAPGK